MKKIILLILLLLGFSLFAFATGPASHLVKIKLCTLGKQLDWASVTLQGVPQCAFGRRGQKGWISCSALETQLNGSTKLSGIRLVDATCYYKYGGATNKSIQIPIASRAGAWSFSTYEGEAPTSYDCRVSEGKGPCTTLEFHSSEK